MIFAELIDMDWRHFGLLGGISVRRLLLQKDFHDIVHIFTNHSYLVSKRSKVVLLLRRWLKCWYKRLAFPGSRIHRYRRTLGRGPF